MLLLSVLGCLFLVVPVLSQEAELSSSCSILRAALCQKQLLQGNLGRDIPGDFILFHFPAVLHPFPSLVSTTGTEGLVLLDQQG